MFLMKKSLPVGYVFANLICLTTFADGGITGGGGGTVPGNPVSMSLIVEAIQQTKSVLKYYFAQKAATIRTNEQNAALTDVEKKLYHPWWLNGNVLDPLKIEIKTTAACEYQGVLSDGSANPGSEYPVCISAYTLAQKLSEYTYKSEIQGLIVHEISHLYGANEELAVRLQRELLKSSSMDESFLSNKLNHLKVNFWNSYYGADEDIGSEWYPPEFDVMFSSFDHFAEIIQRNDPIPVKLIQYPSSGDFFDNVKWGIFYKGWAIGAYMCGSYNSTCLYNYNLGFGGRPVVTAREFYNNYDHQTLGSPTYKTFLSESIFFHYITDEESLTEEKNSFDRDIRDFVHRAEVDTTPFETTVH